MPSGQTIIDNSLTILGILPQGGTPSATDSSAALAELQSMSNAWEIDEGLISALQSITKSLTSTVASYTIGIGGAFSTPVPTRLYKAFIINTGNRNEIKVVEKQQYDSHRDLTATAQTPDEVYLDFNINPTTGYATVYLWPVPTFGSGSPALELETAVPFVTWDLTTDFAIPYGYQDAIQYALAWRLIPQYGGVVAPQVMQTVSELGQKAELRIRTMNSKNRQLPPQVAALEPLTQPPAAAMR